MKKPIVIIIALIIIVLLFSLVLFLLGKGFFEKSCTAEAKICADGSAVGRNPYLNCEFDLCPDEKCVVNGGTWKEFSNGCVDSCELERNAAAILCTQSFTYGCDCGNDMCWDASEERCEDN